MAEAITLLAKDRYTGQRLGRYEVLCRLSSGGMSEIFLAFQRGPGGFQKLVVLKKILPDSQADQDAVRMFLNEARITAGFNHPNIAQVYDLDVWRGELFLGMEFVPGATLIEIARACRSARKPIPVGFTLAAVRETALALHYAHTYRDAAGRKRTVIHRDVAEKNIMVTYDGTTKLLDFGIAKAADWTTRTAAGKVRGTSGYMSPEQILGDSLDGRSDVFSLGVVLHECLTGMRLYYGRGTQDGMRAVLDSDPEPPSRQNPEVMPELDAVVLRTLRRRREERYPSALELARALERAAPEGIWSAEQCGELVQSHFAERRAQTRKLLEELSPIDLTGELVPAPNAVSARRAQNAGPEEIQTVKVPAIARPRIPAAPEPDDRTAQVEGGLPPADKTSDPERTVVRPKREQTDRIPTRSEVAAAESGGESARLKVIYAALSGAAVGAVLMALAMALKLL